MRRAKLTVTVTFERIEESAKLRPAVNAKKAKTVEVKEHNRLNCSKGVIYNNDLRGIPEEEILIELKQQNVTEVKKILKKVNDSLIETGLIILTFSSVSPPESINIGYEKSVIRPFIPMPLRCRKCFRYGHSTIVCQNNKICINCGEEEHLNDDEDCVKATKCINCVKENRSENNHSVLNKKCPVFLKFKELQTIKTVEKVDHKTALEKYKQRHPNDISFAQITRNVVKYDDTQHNKHNNNRTEKHEENITYETPPTTSKLKKPTTVTVLPKNASKGMRNELKNKISPAKNNKKLCTKNADNNETDSDV
ncbi:uncharacterized protein LOC133326987 [Musca vetustissima]|uniref:uncharacterized protein LOC133326987 n=1 Tax=Musca vetustissima TaxID=27455 RepID=UPI002AB73AA7|nr:uncharacterized protein LOC133326987 [Musca vetustissima]